jgi:hypothetical protein
LPITISLLAFYVLWSTADIYIFRQNYDPAEYDAYRRAIHSSTPMLDNRHLCSSNEISLLLVIVSSASHFLERQSIRDTWASTSNIFNIRSQRLFVIGYEYDRGHFKSLVNEAEFEGDMLYLTVDDQLSTMKELYAYRWLDQYCSNVTFTFKTEDDLFVNIYLLHELLNELRHEPDRFQNRFVRQMPLDSLFLAHINPDAHTFLFGWAFLPAKPERNASFKPFYVSREEYARDFYPRYCSGMLVVLHCNWFFSR